MKMIDTETGHEMVEVSGHDKKEYASKGVAGTGLGLGIAGTALWLLSGGLGGGLFGNRAGLAGAAAIGAKGIAYALYQVSQMYHTNNKGIKIDAPLFSIEATKKIYDRRIRPLNKDVTMWDVYVALNAQYHDNINLYEKWFPNATNNEIEDKIVEATISNWFEDEDASSDKVWEYFRVI